MKSEAFIKRINTLIEIIIVTVFKYFVTFCFGKKNLNEIRVNWIQFTFSVFIFCKLVQILKRIQMSAFWISCSLWWNEIYFYQVYNVFRSALKRCCCCCYFFYFYFLFPLKELQTKLRLVYPMCQLKAQSFLFSLDLTFHLAVVCLVNFKSIITNIAYFACIYYMKIKNEHKQKQICIENFWIFTKKKIKIKIDIKIQTNIYHTNVNYLNINDGINKNTQYYSAFDFNDGHLNLAKERNYEMF